MNMNKALDPYTVDSHAVEPSTQSFLDALAVSGGHFMKTAIVLMTVVAASAVSTFAQDSRNVAKTTAFTQSAQENAQESGQLRSPDVPYVPTPPEVVDAMLKVADVQENDVLYDLGSGDGRIPIMAVKKYGVRRAVGIDIDPQRIKEANENARKAGVTDRVSFRNEDLFEADISEATVVTLYLLNSVNERLRPKLLRELRPGTRIVSHAFHMGDWRPEKKINVNGRTVYFWTVPEDGCERLCISPSTIQAGEAKVRAWNKGTPTHVGAKVGAVIPSVVWAGIIPSGRLINYF